MMIGPMLDIEHCQTAAKQLFGFDRFSVRVGANHRGQHDIMSTLSEQLMEKAREIYDLPERSFFVRRFINEGQMDRIIHVTRTRDLELTATREDVERFKDKKMLERGVPLAEALRFVNNRKMKRRTVG